MVCWAATSTVITAHSHQWKRLETVFCHNSDQRPTEAPRSPHLIFKGRNLHLVMESFDHSICWGNLIFFSLQMWRGHGMPWNTPECSRNSAFWCELTLSEWRLAKKSWIHHPEEPLWQAALFHTRSKSLSSCPKPSKNTAGRIPATEYGNYIRSKVFTMSTMICFSNCFSIFHQRLQPVKAAHQWPTKLCVV